MNRASSVLVLFLFAFPIAVYAEVNWDTVPAKKVQLFYPGMASWEYLVGKDHPTGADAVARGEKGCQDCHLKDGVVNILADDIIKGKLRMKGRGIALEPVPPMGLAGFNEMEIQAAYDSTNFYLRLKWQSPEGAGFKDPSLDSKGLSDRVAIQVNGNLKSFNKAGCFITCHNDMSHMIDSPTDSEVTAFPFYSRQKRRDVRHYAYFTRSRGWSGLKPEQDMERYLKSGGFMDLWVAGFKGQEIVVSDESVLSDRTRDLSQDIFAEGTWADGFYTTVITRKLATKDQSDIQLQEGKGFSMGLAVYDNKNGNRKHYVSFPLSVFLGGKTADLTAVKITEGAAPVN